MNYDLISLLAKAINSGKRYHVFDMGGRYVNSYYHEVVKDIYQRCGYKTIYLGA